MYRPTLFFIRNMMPCAALKNLLEVVYLIFTYVLYLTPNLGIEEITIINFMLGTYPSC